MTIATLSTSVQQCINNFAAALIRNKTLILQCIGFTFLWGLIAHGFMFANNNLSHDSLSQIVDGTYTDTWGKARLGRVFVPVYEYIVRGFVTVPWMIGLISLLYIGLASFLVAKIFSLHSKKSLILLTGILSVNVTVTALTATYISDLDADMFAMLASVVAVFCWIKYKKGFLLGAIPLAFSLGIYQSYISTTITLVIFSLILNLLQGQSYKEVIVNGLKAVAMILCAGLLYFCSMKIIFAAYDITLSSAYNSVDVALTMTPTRIIKVALQTYTDTIHNFFYAPSVYRYGITKRIHILLILIPLFIISIQLLKNKIHILNKLLIILLIIILPWAMNICQVLANNLSHNLMHYALWLTYLGVMLLVRWNSDNAILTKWNFAYWSKLFSGFLLLCILIWNVRLANTIYFVKDIENKAAHSLYTKISNDIEHYSNYKIGETQIVFIGFPKHLLHTIPGCDRAYNLVGVWPHSTFTSGRGHHYFRHYLMNPAKFASAGTRDRLKKLRLCKQCLFTQRKALFK